MSAYLKPVTKSDTNPMTVGDGVSEESLRKAGAAGSRPNMSFRSSSFHGTDVAFTP